jgi:hypothetical protein
MTLIFMYISGLIWYRFSFSWQTYLIPNDEESYYFVNRFTQFGENDDSADVAQMIVALMYFMLTTLATVGYGDFYPSSISEKIIGIFIEIFGVTIFSFLMNKFIEVVLKLMGDDDSAVEV